MLGQSTHKRGKDQLPGNLRRPQWERRELEKRLSDGLESHDIGPADFFDPEDLP